MYGTKVENVTATIFCACLVTSRSMMIDTSEVSLSSTIISLPSAGRIFLIACGMTI